ncbi:MULTISPECIES: ATP-binding protein [Flavobacterium]|uniref:ATP-binding protein n=1 Tax=Flavobacterium TaxID=237 RepID=UPI002114EA6D|nr:MULTISPECIES: ATP-binding protein [Flavobacterium]UUF15194.1 ATP-binding protein [Flavobacterium panici]
MKQISFMLQTQSSTNLRNRVNKLHLPKTKPLLPLFEIISNAIHAIEEKKEIEKSLIGLISVKAIRNGDELTLKQVSDIEQYPINSFVIIDNGIGLNDENFVSFQEFDSEKKIDIGGKGIGRLVCLKAFRKLTVDSIYLHGDKFRYRKFEYKKSKEGFDQYEDVESEKRVSGTKISLCEYENEYIKQTPNAIREIGRQIITHFQLYFIQAKQPEIIIKNQDEIELNLTKLFNDEFEKEILQKFFWIDENKFTVFISKSFTAKSHKLHFCAHERTVREEGLSKYISDFRNIIKNSSEEGFYYQVFVVGDFLNNNVNEERTSFNFSIEDDNEEFDTQEMTLAKIRKGTLQTIEELLSVILAQVRKEKLDIYLPIIAKEFPNYNVVVNNNKEKVEKLPAGLNKNELDIKLYEIEAEWRTKVKEDGLDIVEKKKDVTSLEQYKNLYGKFLLEFNEIGQSDLARYVIHRRSVIDLLDNLLGWDDNQKFIDEDTIHSLFFPIRETGQTVVHEKQNLWLLDERLTFNSLLASDKLFKQVPSLNSDSRERIDLIIKKDEVFEKATLFSENKSPFESFTIVEFKKPGRNDYVYGDPAKDPTFQVRRYIRETIDGHTKLKGRPIQAKNNTPFYCYIVADITETLLYILSEESYMPTADGKGYFKFYDTPNYKAYVEVLPFEKVINDAKQRNRILFDKLNLTL